MVPRGHFCSENDPFDIQAPLGAQMEKRFRRCLRKTTFYGDDRLGRAKPNVPRSGDNPDD